MRRTIWRVASALVLMLAASSAQSQTRTVSPDVYIVRVWDCSANHVFKGWAINEGDCRFDRLSSARSVIDYALDNWSEYKGFEVVGQTISQVKRGGIIRSKVWTVYDFQLRKKPGAENVQTGACDKALLCGNQEGKGN